MTCAVCGAQFNHTGPCGARGAGVDHRQLARLSVRGPAATVRGYPRAGFVQGVLSVAPFDSQDDLAAFTITLCHQGTLPEGACHPLCFDPAWSARLLDPYTCMSLRAPQGKKELAVSAYQAAVLMQFNDADKLSFQQLKERTLLGTCGCRAPGSRDSDVCSWYRQHLITWCVVRGVWCVACAVWRAQTRTSWVEHYSLSR